MSTSTKTMYTLLMTLAFVICCLMLTTDLHNYVASNVANFNDTCITLKAGEDCEKFTGYLAVYRVLIVMVAFHFILMIFSIKIPNSNNLRASFHNGYWGFKFCFLIAGGFVSFSIPRDMLFRKLCMYSGMLGGSLFIVIQLIFVIDCGFSLQNKWMDRVNADNDDDDEEGPNRCWLCGMYFFDALLLVVLCLSAVLLFIFYTKDESCYENKIFIVLNSFLCVAMVVISLAPCLKRNTHVGIMQGSIVALYMMYVTWIALVSEPPTKDYTNSTMHISDLFAWVNVSAEKHVFCGPEIKFDMKAGTQIISSWRKASGYIGATMTFAMAIHGCLRMSSSADRIGIGKNSASRTAFCFCCQRKDVEDRGGQAVIFNEQDKVAYNYAFFHAIFILVAFYIMMQLTMWYRPEDTASNSFGLNWMSVWIKMITTWVCFTLFAVSIICPTCIPGRRNLLETKNNVSEREEDDALE